MRHLPPLAAVRVFEAAARHENFTQAAAELGMTQAAVSYQIRLLEERLGLPLFIRSKRRVTLSEPGRKVAPLVSAAFDGISEAFEGITQEDDGVLTISTAQTFAANWLAPRLGTFQIERPELAVRLHTSHTMVDFARDEADVAIRIGTGPWPGLCQHFLMRLAGTPLCTPEFKGRNDIEQPSDLLRVPRLSPQDALWRQWFEVAGVDTRDGDHSGGIRLDTQVAEGNAAMAGHGVALLTPLLWRPELASGRLVRLFDTLAFEQGSLWLVYPEHKRARPKIRAFRAWLERAVAEEAAQSAPEEFTPPEGWPPPEPQ
ncbi:transcriptional regulator GcvA [Sphingosinicella sp. BN140058]|uniref:transcriptional regulator GcvA n=1 Tax=Sphingosinicella sp. BN140058 TaxID=1892855 RepID=UPI0010111695|nr:transcriptional regulator GcvA [Sphingosinicella sp. BN140058]QAY76579.1 transcriptional regulator GcvA [Sphingosinicella sp. BN140058]